MTMIAEDVEAVPTPRWWYSIVRDKEVDALPEGEYEVSRVEGKQKASLLVMKLTESVGVLASAIAADDDEYTYMASAEVLDILSHTMNALGKNLEELDNALDVLADELGGYDKGAYVVPSEAALRKRLERIK